MPKLWIIICSLFLTDCGNIRQSLQTIATADSLDTEHILYRDTAALRYAVRALDKPLVRQCHRTTLAKAYYYLGRNLEDNSLVAEAADCYISADRLHPHDYILCGRINSCMGFICTQVDEENLSLEFYQRANHYFQDISKERYVNGLITISNRYNYLKEFHSADSIWKLAHTFDLGNLYKARLSESRGLYYFLQCQHDSALWHFQESISRYNSTDRKCFSVMKVMQIYARVKKNDKAIPCAQYIIRYSKDHYYRSNAYYVLIEYAEQEQNVDALAEYSHLREDESREREIIKSSYSAATMKLEEYINAPKFSSGWRVTMFIMVIICISLLIPFFRLQDNKRKQTHNSNILLQQKELEIQKINQKLENNNAQYLQQHILQFRTLHPTPPKKWNDYDTFCTDIDSTLPHFIEKLQEKNLQEKEIKLCVYIVLYNNLSLAALSDSLCYSKQSTPTIKLRIAKKLDTTSANLYDILFEMVRTE